MKIYKIAQTQPVINDKNEMQRQNELMQAKTFIEKNISNISNSSTKLQSSNLNLLLDPNAISTEIQNGNIPNLDNADEIITLIQNINTSIQSIKRTVDNLGGDLPRIQKEIIDIQNRKTNMIQ